jgi:hypothetical protein
MTKLPPRRAERLPFQLACWGLGLIAFGQLLAAGVALAMRFEETREVVIEEKIITKLVEVEAPPTPAVERVVALPPLPDMATTGELPPARPLDAPEIADPVVERLVTEAREARVAEDMGSAIVKLEEAASIDPAEPSVHYELGLVYETMAAFDPTLASKATAAFQKVFEMGTSRAGALYSLAAKKLRDGISLPSDMRGKLALGRTRIFKDATPGGDEQVILTIPVRAAPQSEPNPQDFVIEVHFFDEDAKGEILPALQVANEAANRSVEWPTAPIDWFGGEEAMRVTYTIPRSSASDEHLFGRRRYYGQVVELTYKNELIDSQAWPRHLASRSQAKPSHDTEPLFLDEDLPFDGSLLPPLEELPSEPVLPPFPGEN